MIILPHTAKVPPGTSRSPRWAAFERKFLVGKVCIVCGGRRRLRGHHILPFHLYPQHELDEDNVAPICEGNPSINCHLVLGHLGDFRSWNPTVRADAAAWAARMRSRP